MLDSRSSKHDSLAPLSKLEVFHQRAALQNDHSMRRRRCLVNQSLALHGISLWHVFRAPAQTYNYYAAKQCCPRHTCEHVMMNEVILLKVTMQQTSKIT